MTDFYLAAAFTQVREMQNIATILRDMGHEVTSSWIDQPEGEQSVRNGVVADEVVARRHAAMDIFDIERADKMLLFTGVPSSTGGYHSELGYAIGTDKTVLLIGPRTNVFHTLPMIERQFSTWSSFVDYLEKTDAASRA